MGLGWVISHAPWAPLVRLTCAGKCGSKQKKQAQQAKQAKKQAKHAKQSKTQAKQAKHSSILA